MDNIDSINDILSGNNQNASHCWKQFKYNLQESIGGLAYTTSSTSYIEHYYYIADSYTVDTTTGLFTLTNPTYSTLLNYKSLVGKYVCSTNEPSNIIYQITEDAYTTSYSESHSASPSAPATVVAYTNLVNLKMFKYVYTYMGVVKSDSADAYPNEEWVDDIYYVKSISAVTNIPKVAIGTYTGNNKYGASNPVTISFDFEPKIIVVSVNSSFTKTYRLQYYNGAYNETKNQSTNNKVQMSMIYTKDAPSPLVIAHDISCIMGVTSNAGDLGYADLLNYNSPYDYVSPLYMITSLENNNFSFYSTLTYNDNRIFNTYNSTIVGGGADHSAIASFNSQYLTYSYFAIG